MCDLGSCQKSHSEPNNNNKNNLIKEWTEDLNTHFSHEDIQMANGYIERHSTALAIREMQIQTTVRYYLMPVVMAINKKRNNNCERGCEEKKSLVLLVGMQTSIATMENGMWSPQN